MFEEQLKDYVEYVYEKISSEREVCLTERRIMNIAKVLVRFGIQSEDEFLTALEHAVRLRIEIDYKANKGTIDDRGHFNSIAYAIHRTLYVMGIIEVEQPIIDEDLELERTLQSMDLELRHTIYGKNRLFN